MLLVRPARLQMALLCSAAAPQQRRQSAQGQSCRQLKARQTLRRRLPSSLQKGGSMQGPTLQELQRQRPCRSQPSTCRLLRLATACQPLSLLELQMMGRARWCGIWCSR